MSLNTCRIILLLVDVIVGRFLTLSQKSLILWTVRILLRAKTILLSCQAKQRVLLTTFARRVFQSSFLENRFLSVINLVGNSLCGRVVPITPNSQAYNSANKGTDVK